MRTCHYSDVLRGSAALAGMQLSDIGDAELELFRTFHDRRLQAAWEIHRWPELCPVEQRFLAGNAFGRYLPWDPSAVVDPGVYAGSLVLGSGVSAGQVTGLGLGYTPQRAVLTIRAAGGLTLWPTVTALANGSTSLSADGFSFALEGETDSGGYTLDYSLYANVSATPGQPNGAFNLPNNNSYGTVSGLALGFVPRRVKVSVRVPAGGLSLYAQVVDGSVSDDGFSYVLTGATDSAAYKLDYLAEGATASYTRGMSGGLALNNGDAGGAVTGLGLRYVPQQVLVTLRTPAGGALQVFANVIDGTVSSDGFQFQLNGATDATGYQLDYAVVQSKPLEAIGEFLRITDKDPRLTTKLAELPFVLDDRGARLVMRNAKTPDSVWVEYRRRRPELTGAPWDSTAVYTSGRQVYFRNDATQIADFYEANATTVAGQSPLTTPAKWDLVELPYFLRGHLIQAGFADWLTADGQESKASKHEGMALGYLELEADKLQRQQGQVRRFNFRS